MFESLHSDTEQIQPLPSAPPQLVGSSSKTLSFYKPAEDDKFAAAGTAQDAAQAAAQEVAIEGLQDE